MPRLILGSKSPRRAALLQQLELPFEQLPSPDEEPPPEGNDPHAYVVESACAKARAVHGLVQQRRADNAAAIVIGVDTIVCLDGTLMGKPGDPEEAACMLRRLSGHTHQVYTGLALICADGRELRDCAETQVRMGRLSEANIRAYVRSGEPLDKAGAYGIQGLGGRFIEHIEGCYYNVVGLPLARFATLLEEAGYDFSTTTGGDQ
jgi:septum formation protein